MTTLWAALAGEAVAAVAVAALAALWAQRKLRTPAVLPAVVPGDDRA